MQGLGFEPQTPQKKSQFCVLILLNYPLFVCILNLIFHISIDILFVINMSILCVP